MNEPSLLRLYSIGTAASNKKRGSNLLDVTPDEKFTMLNGEINSAYTTVSDKGTLSDGREYTTSANVTNVITATWMPRGTTNRVTPPDIRRGEKVALYRVADSDKFFWNQETSDLSLRRLETVTWLFSGTKDENAETGPETYYCLEISTHDGHVLLHTTNANGEPFIYDMVLNTKEGNFILTDNINNQISVDSNSNNITLQNADNTKVELAKEKINATANSDITVTTKANLIANVTKDATIQATNINATATGNISLTASAIAMSAGGGSGSAEIGGNLKIIGQTEITGEVKFGKSVTIAGSLTVTGPITSGAEVHGTNI